MLSKAKVKQALFLMFEYFPNPQGELNSHNPFELLIAVILSAQTTDVAVNKVTKNLFAKYPDCNTLAQANLQDVINLIKTIGLYHNKAKNIIATAKMLVTDFNGEIPRTIPQLMKLPGVGRKSANVVLADAFQIPTIAVDTHVERVSKRLNIVDKSASVKEVEATLMNQIPSKLWIRTHHTFVLFGRYHCKAQKPKCYNCKLFALCFYAKQNF